MTSKPHKKPVAMSIFAIALCACACGDNGGGGNSGDGSEADGGAAPPGDGATAPPDDGGAAPPDDGDAAQVEEVGTGGSSGTGGPYPGAPMAGAGTSTGGTGGAAATDADFAGGGPESGGERSPLGEDLQDEPVDEPDAGSDQCDTENATVLYLSADDSNSMAGPAVARALIKQGQLVYKGLRTYEFLNYYDFDYPAAEPDRVSVSAQMRQAEDGTYNLQIGVRSPEPSAAARRPFNLTLSVDASSSMGWGREGETAIDRVRDGCRALAGALKQGDIVSIVTWSASQTLLLDSLSVEGADDPRLIEQCDALVAYGTSDLNTGLSEAYRLARKNYDSSRINRVILMSDGGANVGTTEKELIAAEAQDAEGEAIYLLGAGMGDPWNYNDEMLNAVTDAGKGAYLFIDSEQEAEKMFGPRLLSNLELAARDVQVALTLPPTLQMAQFHGEAYSAEPEQVEPQHLALGDAMIFHQVLESCDSDALDMEAEVRVTATYEHPTTREVQSDEYASTLGELLDGERGLLLKGDAVVAYAETLKELRTQTGSEALQHIDDTVDAIDRAAAVLGDDADLMEIAALLSTYRGRFDGTAAPPVAPTSSGDDVAILPSCSGCSGVGGELDNMRCAIELCDDELFLEQNYSSPSDSAVDGTFAAVRRFGSARNDLEPRHGDSYALMATGPATGTDHSRELGGQSVLDPFAADADTDVFDVMEWRLRLQAPPTANGFSIRYVYFSEEYDDYIGTEFNDKFYVFLEAGSTNGGKRTVINFTECRDSQQYYDFVCGQGMQYCNPGERYCYIAINTALSECCWYGGCQLETDRTDISGTGYECAFGSSTDFDAHGSSTGWMETQWPIEPNEVFDLTFHIHDSGDGIYDSEVILDRFVFLEEANPGTAR